MAVDVSMWRKGSGRLYDQLLADDLDSGRVVSGTEKLAQRFLLQLMTRSGSVPQSTVGCEFVDRLLTGNVTTESDVFVIFAASINTVSSQLRAEELADDTDDEKFAGVGIVDLTLSGETLQLNLRLRTVAGSVTNIAVPLNFVLA